MIEKNLDNINYIKETVHPIKMVIISPSFNSNKELRNGIIVAVIVKSEEELNLYEDFVDDYNGGQIC